MQFLLVVSITYQTANKKKKKYKILLHLDKKYILGLIPKPLKSMKWHFTGLDCPHINFTYMHAVLIDIQYVSYTDVSQILRYISL